MKISRTDGAGAWEGHEEGMKRRCSLEGDRKSGISNKHPSAHSALHSRTTSARANQEDQGEHKKSRDQEVEVAGVEATVSK